MNETLKNILYFTGTGVLLVFVLIAIRFTIRFTWKFIRAALILVSLLLIAGYFFGYFDIVIH